MSFYGSTFNPSDVFTGQQSLQPWHVGTYPHHLNPAVPRFQPAGMELQRFHADSISRSPMTPASSGMHSSQVLDHVSRQTQKNAAEIAEIKEVFARDFRELQRQIRQSNSIAEPARLTPIEQGPGVLDIQVASPTVMTAQFGLSTTAKIYLEQAQRFENQAAELKRVAWTLCPENGTHTDEAAAPMSDKIPAKATEVSQGTSFDTPTHAPPRRSQPSGHSRATQMETQRDIKRTAIPDAATQTSDQMAVPLVNKTEDKVTAGNWVPLPIRGMKALPEIKIKSSPTFTWEFLKMTLQGEQWSPGFYFIQPKNQTFAAPPSQSYWILEKVTEPYLPSAPGQHGAKLTAFFNNTFSDDNEAPTEDNYMHVPVFICNAADKDEYVYYGQYSQTRFSDRLDHERVMVTPAHVRAYWATQLADKGRPEWVTQELMTHFWPKPTYDGPMPTDSGISTPATAAEGGKVERRVARAVELYAAELKEWEKEARMKVNLLTPKALMDSFERADSDEEPGLRLWWEYLECVAYDEKFVQGLQEMKEGKKVKAVLPISPPSKAAISKVAVAPHKKNPTTPPEATAPSASPASPSTVICHPSTTSSSAPNPSKPPAKQVVTSTPTTTEGNKTTIQGDLKLAKQLSEEFKDGGGSGKAAHKRGGKNHRGGAGAMPPNMPLAMRNGH